MPHFDIRSDLPGILLRVWGRVPRGDFIATKFNHLRAGGLRKSAFGKTNPVHGYRIVLLVILLIGQADHLWKSQGFQILQNILKHGMEIKVLHVRRDLWVKNVLYSSPHSPWLELF